VFGLPLQRPRARVGELVVPAQPALCDLLGVEFDQLLGGQSVQHPVQGADLELHPAAGEVGHLTDDPVAVARLIDQRGEHEERRFGHRL